MFFEIINYFIVPFVILFIVIKYFFLIDEKQKKENTWDGIERRKEFNQWTRRSRR